MPTKNNELLIQGRNDQGQFIGRKEQVDGLRAAVQKLSIEQNKLNAQVVKSLGTENSLLKGKSKLQAAIAKSVSKQLQQAQKAGKEIENRLKAENKLIQQNLKLSTQLNNLRMKAARSGGGGGLFGGGGGSGGLLRSLAGISVLAVAVRQLKEISDSRLGTYLNNGSGATRATQNLGGRGIAPVSKFQAVNEFQSSGLSQFIIGQQKEIQSGLLKAQAELSRNVGASTANELLGEINKSFGADSSRRKAFFESVGTQGLSRSLSDFASQYNIESFTRAGNALTSPADPALQVRSQLLDVTEQLKASFEKLALTLGSSLIPLLDKLTPTIKGLLDFVGGLTTTQVAVGAGALVAARYGGASLLKGAGNAVAGGTIKALPYAGRAAGQLTGHALKGALPLAHALALPALAGAAYANAKEGYGVMTDTRDAFNSVNSERNWTPTQGGSSERDALAFQRGKIDKQLQNIFPAKIEKSWLGLEQLTGELTEQQVKQVAKLGEQRRAIQRDIDALDKRSSAESKATATVQKTAQAQDSLSSKIQKRLELELPIAVSEGLSNLSREQLGLAQLSPFGTRQATPETQALIKSLTDQKSLLQESLATIDENLPQGVIDANNLRTQIVGLEKEIRANSIGLQTMPLEFQQTLSDLKRQEFQFKSMSPFGAIGAYPEMQEVNASLRKEIDLLTQIASSSELTAFEQVKVKSAILSREMEQRQNLRGLLDAYKDQALQQVAGSVGHRSIIVTQDANLGIGLRSGMISRKVPKEIVGNVDPRVTPLMPRSKMDVLGGYNPFTTAKPKTGATPAESMKFIGEYMIKIGSQLQSTFQDIQNQLAEPIGSYGSGRLSN